MYFRKEFLQFMLGFCEFLSKIGYIFIGLLLHGVIRAQQVAELLVPRFFAFRFEGGDTSLVQFREFGWRCFADIGSQNCQRIGSLSFTNCIVGAVILLRLLFQVSKPIL